MTNTILTGVLVPRTLIGDVCDFGGKVSDDCVAGDLVVREGRAVCLTPSQYEPGKIVIPRLTEPHVHLDKCFTVGRIENVGGDLAAAIEAQRADMANWTEADIRHRAARAIKELEKAGCGAVRTHVDWDFQMERTGAPTAWEVLRELATESHMIVQRAALVGIDHMIDGCTAHSLARDIARDGGVMGAFVLDQDNRETGLANMFREADRLGLALDFHVDEGLSPGLDGIELIADIALSFGFGGPILCGHACSLANLPDGDVRRIADKLAEAGITIAVLPQTNLYLQGRTSGTPDRRGITRLHELRAAGVNVTVGVDNVCDAFCPVGRHDPLYTLNLSVLAAHLDPPIGGHLPLITTNAQAALGLAPVTVDGTHIDDLLIFDADSTAGLLNAPVPQSFSDVLRNDGGQLQ